MYLIMLILHVYFLKANENDVCVTLDAELCLKDQIITGTQHSTGHILLLNARIELPASSILIFSIIKSK